MKAVTIGHAVAGLADFRAIEGGASIRLDTGARAGVDRGAQLVATIIGRDAAVYGINTGFGKLAQTRIRSEDLATLQRNLVLSHAAGVGAPLPAPVVRLAIALKIASLAKGYSGVRWEVIEALAALLDKDVLPVIPGQGSVGASGDLAPLAHLTTALIGEGEVMFRGSRMSASAGLAAAGLKPVQLGPKEGLALLNGTQISTALALTGLFAMERVFASAIVAGAMTLDAIEGSDTPFDDRIHRIRPHVGQRRVAKTLRELATGSAIREKHRTCAKVQDPYSLRCQPQVMGAVLDLMSHAAHILGTEANAVSDNPLVFAEEGDVISGGNFHAEPVALTADVLALGLAEIGNISERRISILVDPVMSGLPAFLTSDPGLNSGFMIAQVTAAALTSENKQRAAPASIDTIPTSANQEDHVSMATHAARRLGEMNANAARIIAVELMAAAQGIDFRAPGKSSAAIEKVRSLIRSKVAKLGVDRLMGPDIETVATMVETGQIVAAAGIDLFSPEKG